MPEGDRPSRFVRELLPFGAAAKPAAEFYYAAEDQQAAAGRLTVVSREILRRLQLSGTAGRSVPAVMAYKLGYSAGLSAEAAGVMSSVSSDDLPPLDSGIAGPKPSSVREHSTDIMRFVVGLGGRIIELIPVPEPVWQGFERAVAVRLAENYGRAGRKVSAETGTLVVAGYLARLVDQAYGLTPEGSAPQERPEQGHQ